MTVGNDRPLEGENCQKGCEPLRASEPACLEVLGGLFEDYMLVEARHRAFSRLVFAQRPGRTANAEAKHRSIQGPTAPPPTAHPFSPQQRHKTEILSRYL